MNPFKYGSIVLGKDFCGREDLLKQISNQIKASQNIAVFGERRVGKRCKGGHGALAAPFRLHKQ